MNIHIIPYTHADYAWTHTRQWHLQRYSFILNEVLDMMRDDKELTYTIDNLLFLNCISDRLDEVKKYVSEGRIEIMGGIVSLVRPTQIGKEAFIRNIQFGRKRIFDLLGEIPINVYHNVDVGIGHSQIPQLMKLSGIKYYRGWRPEFAMDSRGIPRQFIWKGMDGSELITSRGPYFGFYNLADGDFYDRELKDIVEKSQTDEIWLSQGMDDTRLLRDSDDTKIDLNTIRTKIPMNFSTPAKYFTALEKYNLPVVADVLDPADVGYNAPIKGQNGLWRMRQDLEKELTALEKLCTLAMQFGFTYPDTEELWYNYILICGHAMEFVLHDDFEEIISIYHNVLCYINNIKKLAVNVIANKANSDITMINTDLKRKKEFVCVNLSFPTGGYDFEIKDSNNNTVEYQVISRIKGDIAYNHSLLNDIKVLFEADVPAMGYATYKIVKSDNKHTDILTDKEIYDPFKLTYTKQKNNSWLYSNEAESIVEFVPEKTKVLEQGPLRWRHAEYGSIGSTKAIKEITVYKGRDYIDYKIDLIISESDCGYYTANIALKEGEPQIYGGIPFGCEKKDIEKERYCETTERYWENLERQWDGVFYSMDFVRFQSSSIVGKTTAGYYRYNKDYLDLLLTRTLKIEEMDDWEGQLHSSMNGIGKHSFEFSYFPQSDPDVDNCDPLIAETRWTGNASENYSLFEINADNVAVSACYYSNDRYMIRLYETKGVETEFSIISNIPVKSIKSVDFIGNEREFYNKISPFEIITLEIR